jgi:hypothetical protein
MKRSDEALLGLADVAAGQWGLFTTAQAAQAGLSVQAVSRLAAKGVAERLRHGVYRLSGAPPHEHADLQALWLSLDPSVPGWERIDGDPGAVISHGSAARLHGLGDLDAVWMEITAPVRRQLRDPHVRVHVARLTRDDWSVREGLPVTTVLRTVVDLAHAGVDGGHLAGVLRDAIATHQLDRAALAAALRPVAHRYGVAVGDGTALVDLLLAQAGMPVQPGSVIATSTLLVRGQTSAAGPPTVSVPAFDHRLDELRERVRALESAVRLAGGVPAPPLPGAPRDLTPFSPPDAVARSGDSEPDSENGEDPS